MNRNTEKAFELLTGLKMHDAHRMSGGSINEVWLISSGNKKYVIKANRSDSFPGMFRKESNGLKMLESTLTVRTPEVIAQGEFNDEQFLVLEYLHASSKQKDYNSQLGKSLASLHRNTSAYAGWEEDNYIGSLVQVNNTRTDTLTFFIEQRLIPMISLAVHTNRLNRNISNSCEQLILKLNDLLPNEPPALLHGDLWSGNVITGNDGYAVLIDPSVYYGAREADLAMTDLFGGFDDDFYESYHESFPLISGWRERFELWNLYPLLVHLNLFGESYLTPIKSVLKKYL